MKKRLIGSLLFGALIAASTGTFVSCTNYDDDFDALRSEIKAQQDLIAQLQDKVKNGDVIQSVTPISGGILVTLSDGSTYSIVNGKDGLNGVDGLNGQDGRDGRDGKDGQNGKDGVDGQNGVVWEIDAETGYWKRDGVLTEYKAVGIDGTSAVAPTIDIVDGYWVINGQNTGVKAVGVDGKDGQNGQDGKDGQDGKNGVDGKDGQDGKNGVDGKDGQDGKNGVDGKDGKDGQDGKDGLTPTVEINAEGYWVINGVTSNVKAQGRDGVDGKNGQDGKDGLPGLTGDAGQNGQNGYYYVPNTDTGCFDIYMDGVKIAETEIAYMATGAVTAVLDQQNLSVYGLTSGDVKVCLASYLRSLVFKPYLYLDGIETIEYPFLVDSVLQLLPQAPSVQRTRDKIQQNISNGKSKYSVDRVDFKDWVADQYPKDTKNVPNGLDPKGWITAVKTWFFYPTIGVDYHMNPANADVEYSDVAGYSVLNPDVLYFNTRGISDITVTSPEKNFASWGHYKAGKFTTSKGIVTAGLKIDGVEKIVKNDYVDNINYYPTDEADNLNDITVALQINSKTSDGSKDPITSDYALIKPTKIWLEGLIWTKNPTYKKGGKTRKGDQLGIIDNQKIHVWDSPEEAILDEDGAALELYWNDADGINLSEWLGIHYVYEDLKTRTWKTGIWTFGQETPWGLHYEFNLVDYFIDTNKTRDSRYADWGPINGKTAAAQNKGQLVARNVKASGDNDWEGYTIEEQSETSVDREPLVQVLVKNEANEVIMDGYILVHISGTPDVEPDNIEIANLPLEDVKHFDLCDSEDDWVFEVDWAEFSDYGLTQTLDNMTKEYFDANYEADIKQANVETTATGDEVDYLYIYKKFTKNGNDTPENMTVDKLGTVKYYPNWLGTTNHRIQWYLSTEEWEELTHDQNLPRTEVRYVRFKEKAGVSPRPKYPYIYVKMTLRVDRKINADKFGTKNKNYWFDLDGKDGQLLSSSSDMQAVIYDIREPRDYFYANEFSGRIRSTLLAINGENKENTVNTHKYYFLPETRVIDTQYGKYRLTPEGSDNPNWNMFYCLYIVNNTHKYTNVADMKALLDKCAIDYNKGVFNNASYYAIPVNNNNVATGVGTKIATLNPENGVITLLKNDVTKAVLNAVGYQAPVMDGDKKMKQPNILTELTAWLGVVAKNGCDVAMKVNEGEMLTSWQRPINLDPTEVKVAIDANTNGNFIYLIDYLKLFDWRGPETGDMMANRWFWAYYMVKSITVDMTPANVKTNMHVGPSATPVPLNTITTMAHLTQLDKSNGVKTYNFWSGISGFNSADKNQAIKDYMNTHKAEFGGFYYENNGDNVQEFEVQIPITIEYEWGKFKQTVTWKIKRTVLDH